MAHISRHILTLTMVLALAGCSTISGWFESDDDDANAPAELADIEETVNIEELWSTGIGNGQGDGLFRLRPAIRGATIYVASSDGEVAALDRNSGDTLWEVELETSLSGGVGVYEDALFLGGGDGSVLKLDANSGERIWATPVRGEILSPPQSNGRVVVVQTNDGKLQGLDFSKGTILWTYDSNIPVLTVRGTSSPIVHNDLVYAGFANGRVLALDAQTGAIAWEVRVAIAQGRSEIERLVDIDGTMELAGDELYAASYQGNLVAIDVGTGTRMWQQKVSSHSGVSQDSGNVYVADEDGTIAAYMRSGEGARWTQADLAYRELTRPTPVGSYVAVADFEGYVHVLSQDDGAFVGRVQVDDDGARADMLSEGNVLYVFGNSGELVAYEITPKD
jgi:outer membrane protein assembly factor BamB